MRGIRIAAFSVAAVLACVVISHMLSLEPAAEEDSQAVEAPDPETAPTVVPAPPPAASEPASEPVKKSPAHAKAAQAHPAAAQPVQDADRVAPSPEDARPVIWQANELAADAAEPAAAPLPAPAATEEQKGPVIVVPHERPKEEKRGSRWLRAFGRALGIGGPKDPGSRPRGAEERRSRCGVPSSAPCGCGEFPASAP